MIFLPVTPVSPCGPPITNLPVGLIWYLMWLLKSLAYFLYFDFTLGIRISTMSFLIFSCILASVEKSSCWVDTTMASILTGLLLSSYSRVTWLLASGRRYLICLFSLLRAA